MQRIDLFVLLTKKFSLREVFTADNDGLHLVEVSAEVGHHLPISVEAEPGWHVVLELLLSLLTDGGSVLLPSLPDGVVFLLRTNSSRSTCFPSFMAVFSTDEMTCMAVLFEMLLQSKAPVTSRLASRSQGRSAE